MERGNVLQNNNHLECSIKERTTSIQTAVLEVLEREVVREAIKELYIDHRRVEEKKRNVTPLIRKYFAMKECSLPNPWDWSKEGEVDLLVELDNLDKYHQEKEVADSNRNHDTGTKVFECNGSLKKANVEKFVSDNLPEVPLESTYIGHSLENNGKKRRSF